ncbi:putative cytochrome P450 [Ixodes scapularis]
MQQAGVEEARRAKESGEIDAEGYPLVTVVADCAWSKRSYRHKNGAPSGTVDCQKNPTDPLLMGVQKVFEDVDNAVIVNAIRFPILRKILEWLYPYASYYKIINKITENVLNVVKLRRSGQSPRTTDMLQLMLDAQTSGEESSVGSGSNATVFEDRHLLSNCFLFLIAGFDTTASSLAFIMHVLAKYPEEQERVFNEISKAFPDGAELTYDGVQHLKRLDMVVCETLRLYPPVVLFVSRHCTQDTTVSERWLARQQDQVSITCAGALFIAPSRFQASTRSAVIRGATADKDSPADWSASIVTTSESPQKDGTSSSATSLGSSGGGIRSAAKQLANFLQNVGWPVSKINTRSAVIRGATADKDSPADWSASIVTTSESPQKDGTSSSATSLGSSGGGIRSAAKQLANFLQNVGWPVSKIK